MDNKGHMEIMIKIGRAFIAFIAFLFAFSMFNYCFVTERNGEELVTKAVRDNLLAVASVCVFSSVYSVFARYDMLSYDEFTSNRTRKFKLADDALRVVRSFDFIFDCVLLAVMSFLLPMPIAFPIMIVLDFIIRVYARKSWYSGPPVDGSELWAIIRELVLWTLGYCAIAYIGPSYVGIFGIVGMLAVENIYVTLGIIFVPAIIYFLISYAIAFAKRIKFINMLRRTCKNNGYKLSKIKRPYFSILDVTETEDFTVEANGKIYVCKLLSGKRGGIPIIFSDDGTAAYEHGIGLGRAKVVNYYKSFSYELPDKGVKCVIVTHYPRKFFYETQGSTRHLHLGDRFGRYNLLHPDALLRGIESNTII